MKIVQLSQPFYHTIIYDFYTAKEVKSIWRELKVLRCKFENKHFNGDPLASDNKLGLHLDQVYHGFLLKPWLVGV